MSIFGAMKMLGTSVVPSFFFNYEGIVLTRRLRNFEDPILVAVVCAHMCTDGNHEPV